MGHFHFPRLGRNATDGLGVDDRSSREEDDGGSRKDEKGEEEDANDESDNINAAIEASNHVLQTSDGEKLEAGQDGLTKAQATTIVWSRTALLVIYAFVFIIFFTNSLDEQISSNLLPYVTSAFSEHSLTATTIVLYTLIAGTIKLPVAKIMDVWGRPQGFVLMLSCAVIGLIMMASCTSVELYAAAQVFFWVGLDGIGYVLDVFIADTSSLKYRGLMFAFSNSPYVATTFAGPAAANAYHTHSSWRWAFGTFAIVTPVVCLPWLLVFWYNQRLAEKQGVLQVRREASGRTWWQSFAHYFIEFDVIGLILIVAGWALILLPLSLATSVASQWKSPAIISMIVIGVCLLVVFALYERFLARKPFLPFHLLLDRTVIGACLSSATLFLSFYTWDPYFQSYLQVVHNLSLTDAGYVYNIFNVGAAFWGIVVGGLILWTHRFKWMAVAAVPVQILGTGLMIYLRQPGWGIGVVVMCQVLIAVGGGTIVITQQVAIMAAVGPDHIPAALALQALFTSVGGAVGTSVSGAIWTNTFLPALRRHLPPAVQPAAQEIYNSLDLQLSHPAGSPARHGIDLAYGEGQKYMCIAGTAVLALQMIWVLLWRNHDTRDFRKPNGAKII